jgi:hypothetical protein
MKTILILLTIFILLFVVLSFIDYKITENFYSYIDPKNLINDPKKCYVLWTGGYDSSFRVLQALIDENKTVQPIYISDLIDNEPGKKTHRKNKEKEYKAMNKITKLFRNKFPHLEDKLLDFIDIKKIDLDDDTKYHMAELKKKKSVRRTTCQYGAISQLSKDINENRHGKDVIHLELGVVKEDYRIDKFKNIGIYNTINNNIDISTYKISSNLNHNSVNLFRYCRFPLIDVNKKDMLKIAGKGGYSDILTHSWSCWYPKKDGNPCGKCIMCKERILK